MKASILCARLCVGLSALATSQAAFAQETAPASADESSTATGDIVVTARRREEALQDVPISVTALSGAALTQQGVRSIADVDVPSLKITTAASLRNVAVFSLRGQRTQETQLLTDPAVGTYFAEVVQPRPFGFGQSLYDIQSVQVLKGVQGTLFGRNMTGGAVLVEPVHPKDEFEGEVRGTVGNFDLREIYGMLNVPLGNFAALRVAGKMREREGFSRDISTGRDYDDQNFDTFRVSLLLKPSESIESLTIFDWFKAKEHGTAVFLTALRLQALNPDGTPQVNGMGQPVLTPLGSQERARGFGLPLANFPAQLAQAQALFAAKRYRFEIGAGEGGLLDAPGVLPFEKNKNWGIQNKTTFDLGGATLKNIFGYREVSRSNVQDYDGIPGFIITPFQAMSAKNYSEELQLQGDLLEDRLNYTIGAFYFLEKGTDGSDANTLPELTILGALGPGALATTPASLFTSRNFGTAKAETYAFYAAGTYKFSDQFSFSGGIRYNNDKRSVTVFPHRPNLNLCQFDDNNASTPTPSLANCPASNSASWDDITWDATLQFEPNDDLTAYVSTRRGFRAGGFSLRAQSATALLPFDPETVQEYEIGMKNRFDLGSARLTTSAALFYQDYKNVQKQNPRGIDTNGDGQNDTVVTIIENTAKQENYGGEIEANLQFDNGLTLGAYYSYVDVNVLKGAVAGEFVMRGIPHHQAGANFAYRLPIAEDMGELTLSGSVSYQSRVPLDDRDAPGVEPGYALAKARLSWDNISGTGIGAALFVNNIFDKLYRVGQLGLLAEVGFLSSVYGEPRNYGLEVGFKF